MNERLSAQPTTPTDLLPIEEKLTFLVAQRTRLKNEKPEQIAALIEMYSHRIDVLTRGTSTFSADEIEEQRTHLVARCTEEVEALKQYYNNRIRVLSMRITNLRRKIRRDKKRVS